MGKDSKECGAVPLLMTLYSTAVAENQTLAAIIPAQAIQMVLHHGLCEGSPVAFTVCTLMLANHFGQFELGKHLALLSIELTEGLKTCKWRPQVGPTACGCAFSMWQPLASMLDPLSAAFPSGLTGRDRPWHQAMPPTTQWHCSQL